MFALGLMSWLYTRPTETTVDEIKDNPLLLLPVKRRRELFDEKLTSSSFVVSDYIHHGDLAPGTSHLRTTIAEGQALMRAMHGRLSGLCQPTYVLDIPGGHGKSPIGPNYLARTAARAGAPCYEIEDFRGCRHAYPPA